MHFSNETGELYDKRKAWHSSLRLYALVAPAIVGLGMAGHLVDRQLALDSWSEMDQRKVETASSHLYSRFSDSLSELLILASHGEWFADAPASRHALAKAFTRVVRVMPRYHQLRLIDLTGMEVVRVNAVDGVPAIVPTAKLQNKADRSYFSEGMALKPGEVYVSPMDLNVEHGEIERPLRPMIRFVMPAIDDTGDMQGILEANFSADILLQGVALHEYESPTRLMLLNNEGYWLYSEKSEDAWGFQLPHGRRFADTYAEAWSRL